MEGNPQLAAVAFGLGVVALMWVFRRTLLRAARFKHDPDEQAYRLRKHAAGVAIEEIDVRERWQTYRRSMLLRRNSAGLDTAQQAELVRLSAWQAAARRNG